MFFESTQEEDEKKLLFCIPGLTDDTRVRFVQHQQFKDQKKWPLKTEYACWHCTESFDGVPIPIPLHHDPDKNVYKVMGIFCSFSCAKGYLHEHPNFNTTMCLCLFSEMVQNVFGVHDKIYIAPPRTSLQKFGGPYTLTEFRENSQTLDTLCKVPPLVYTEMFYQETHYGPSSEDRSGELAEEKTETTPAAFNEYVQKVSTTMSVKSKNPRKKVKTETDKRGTLLQIFEQQ